MSSSPKLPASQSGQTKPHGTAPQPFYMCPRSTTIGICLAVFTCLLFADVWRFESINLDDPAYFTANPHVQSGLTPQGVIWAFTTGHAGNWHPLTGLSHMLDAQLFGPGPRGPHAVNL